VAIVVASTLLTAGYFLPIVFRAFFVPAGAGTPETKLAEAPWPIVAALVVTAGGTLLLFFAPGIPYGLATLMIGG
jgi:multicomponent Na+:H+ antiporter subunit D